MKNVLALVLIVSSSITLAKTNLDIVGNYQCVDISVNSTTENTKLTHGTSMTEMSVSGVESDDYMIKFQDNFVPLIEVNLHPDAISIKGLMINSLKKLGTTYDKIEMTYFSDANHKIKALIEGLTVVDPAKDESNPRAYKYAIECTKIN